MDWTRYIADNVLIFMFAYNKANCYTATVCVPLKCNSVLKYQGPVVCCKLLALINSGNVWTGLGMQQTMWAYFCSSIVAHSKANCYTVTVYAWQLCPKVSRPSIYWFVAMCYHWSMVEMYGLD